MTISPTKEMAESEDLRTRNYRLSSTVHELRLEISYYQGEAKRLAWEKTLLKQDVGTMSAMFKGWLGELQNSSTRSVLKETDFFKNLVNNPSKNIADIMQTSDLMLLITSCQAPFYIEYTNKAWSMECGWENHEVLGLTCSFMQGEVSIPNFNLSLSLKPHHNYSYVLFLFLFQSKFNQHRG